MGRPGRKANSKAKRRQTTRAGQGRELGGTQELMAHKMAATGRHDAELNLIGFLWGRGHLSTEGDDTGVVLRDAAYTVRSAHLHQFGSPEARSSSFERGARGQEGFDALSAVIAQLPWEAVETTLCAISRVTYDDVINLCVYGRGMPDLISPKWERWLGPGEMGAGERRRPSTPRVVGRDLPAS
jgi:hypothetical protein